MAMVLKTFLHIEQAFIFVNNGILSQIVTRY